MIKDLFIYHLYIKTFSLTSPPAILPTRVALAGWLHVPDHLLFLDLLYLGLGVYLVDGLERVLSPWHPVIL